MWVIWVVSFLQNHTAFVRRAERDKRINCSWCHRLMCTLAIIYRRKVWNRSRRCRTLIKAKHIWQFRDTCCWVCVCVCVRENGALRRGGWVVGGGWWWVASGGIIPEWTEWWWPICRHLLRPRLRVCRSEKDPHQETKTFWMKIEKWETKKA